MNLEKDLDPEVCIFCEKEAEYFDFNDKGIINICKKHLKLEASS